MEPLKKESSVPRAILLPGLRAGALRFTKNSIPLKSSDVGAESRTEALPPMSMCCLPSALTL